MCLDTRLQSENQSGQCEESVSLPCSRAAAYFDLCLIFLLLRFNLRTWRGGERQEERGGEGEGREKHGLNALIIEISGP